MLRRNEGFALRCGGRGTCRAEGMEQFCDDLRRERQRSGVSLEAMSRITKFSQRHLLALETGDLASLPGGVFRKGILRSYLSTLRTEPGPWLKQFDECVAKLEGQAETPESLAAFAENVSRARGGARPEPSLWPGVAVMLLLLVAFGWCVWHFALRDRLVLTRLAPAEHRASWFRRSPG